MSINRLPIIRHGQYTWDKALLPESEFERRLVAVRAAMKERGFEAFVVYADMNHSGRAAWLINCHVFDPRMPNLVIVTASGFDAVLKVTGRDLIFFQKFTPARLCNVDFLSGDMAGKLRELAAESGVVGKRIGFVGIDYAPADFVQKFRRDFGAANIECCDDLYTELQRQKSNVEANITRIAATKAQTILDVIAAHAKPGVSEQLLGARADYAARAAGAQDVEFLVYSRALATPGVWPKECLPFRPITSHTLADGDELGVFLAIQLQGYWVEISQTLFIGNPRPGRMEAQREATSRFDALLRTMRPDANSGAEHWTNESLSVWTHGEGNDRDEPPFRWSAGERLASGDLMAAHIALRTKEGPIFLGRHIGISDTGGRILSEGQGGRPQSPANA